VRLLTDYNPNAEPYGDVQLIKMAPEQRNRRSCGATPSCVRCISCEDDMVDSFAINFGAASGVRYFMLSCCYVAPRSRCLWLWDGVKNFWYAYRQAWSAIGTTRFFDYL
jgi:hypothetical protein